MENLSLFTNIVAPLSILGVAALAKLALDHSRKIAKLEQHQDDQDKRWWPMLQSQIEKLEEKLDEVLESLRRDNGR